MQISDIAIQIDRVTRAFDRNRALDEVSVPIRAGEFTVLLGPSGCGKSTLLRLIAGLDTQTDGTILIEGQDMRGTPPGARGLSMVFQSYALFPHLSVRQNILFGLAVRKTSRAVQAERLKRVAEMMGLGPLLDRKPSQLSGGQQQRVALARAVISDRPICLMDEPLSNLDAKLRADMRVELRSIQKQLGLTVVYVTHDQVEAMTMADRIIVMNGGRIEQVGIPEAIYARPETTFTASFIGTPPMNLFPASALFSGPANLTVGIRPEDLHLTDAGPRADLVGVEYLGADRLVAGQINGTPFVLRQPAQSPTPRDRFHIGWSQTAMNAFDATTGKRLHDFDFSSLSPNQKDFDHETA